MMIDQLEYFLLLPLQLLYMQEKGIVKRECYLFVRPLMCKELQFVRLSFMTDMWTPSCQNIQSGWRNLWWTLEVFIL